MPNSGLQLTHVSALIQSRTNGLAHVPPPPTLHILAVGKSRLKKDVAFVRSMKEQRPRLAGSCQKVQLKALCRAQSSVLSPQSSIHIQYREYSPLYTDWKPPNIALERTLNS